MKSHHFAFDFLGKKARQCSAHINVCAMRTYYMYSCLAWIIKFRHLTNSKRNIEISRYNWRCDISHERNLCGGQHLSSMRRSFFPLVVVVVGKLYECQPLIVIELSIFLSAGYIHREEAFCTDSLSGPLICFKSEYLAQIVHLAEWRRQEFNFPQPWISWPWTHWHSCHSTVVYFFSVNVVVVVVCTGNGRTSNRNEHFLIRVSQCFCSVLFSQIVFPYFGIFVIPALHGYLFILTNSRPECEVMDDANDFLLLLAYNTKFFLGERASRDLSWSGIVRPQLEPQKQGARIKVRLTIETKTETQSNEKINQLIFVAVLIFCAEQNFVGITNILWVEWKFCVLSVAVRLCALYRHHAQSLSRINTHWTMCRESVWCEWKFAKCIRLRYANISP